MPRHRAGSRHNAVRVRQPPREDHMANRSPGLGSAHPSVPLGLVACVVGLVITGSSCGGAVMQWHARLGYAVLTLLLFRICWGFLGGRWSRFSSFLHSPRQRARLPARPGSPRSPGRPQPDGRLLGACHAGLSAGPGGDRAGRGRRDFLHRPLNRFVDSARGLAATWYHKRVGQWVIVGAGGASHRRRPLLPLEEARQPDQAHAGRRQDRQRARSRPRATTRPRA